MFVCRFLASGFGSESCLFNGTAQTGQQIHHGIDGSRDLQISQDADAGYFNKHYST